MRPETWRKRLESPTVATGTDTLRCKPALPPADTVTCIGETEIVCGEPAPLTIETAKVAGDEPRFSTRKPPSRDTSPVDSTTPKLTLGKPLSVRAMTDELAAAAGCTSPLPPRRAE